MTYIFARSNRVNLLRNCSKIGMVFVEHYIPNYILPFARMKPVIYKWLSDNLLVDPICPSSATYFANY